MIIVILSIHGFRVVGSGFKSSEVYRSGFNGSDFRVQSSGLNGSGFWVQRFKVLKFKTSRIWLPKRKKRITLKT
jgi:hypothetical protein